MANHKSAIKRHRQSVKRRNNNRSIKASVRTVMKKVRAAAETGDVKAARELIGEAESAIAKAATKGVYHKKNAARKISRLASLVNTSASK